MLRRDSLLEPEPVFIVPEENPVFVKIPGDHLLTGMLRSLTNGYLLMLRQIHRGCGSSESGLLYVPQPDYRVYASIAYLATTFHKNNNRRVQEHSSFVKGRNNAVLKARPQPLLMDGEIEMPVFPYMFVRMPSFNIVYGGH